MNLIKEKVLIVEQSRAHQDLIYAQVLFLIESGFKPVLWVNEKIAFQQDLIKGEFDIIKYKFDSSAERKIFAKELIRYVKNNKIKKIVFNTAQGVKARNIIMRFLFKKVKIIGLLHDGKKLSSGFTQWSMSLKIKKYFVLNDYIADYCSRLKLKNVQVKALYPYFTPHNPVDVNENPGDHLLICIPGEVSVERRNYSYLIDTLIQKRMKLHPSVKFVFLGSPVGDQGNKILQKIEDNNLGDIIETYNSYIEEKVYLNVINKSDILLPLIDPMVKSFNEYNFSKISGAWSVGFSFRKPLLTHVSMSHIEDFRNISFFYDYDNLIEIINSVCMNKLSLMTRVEKYEEIEKFKFEYQRKFYINYISG